MVYEEGYFFLKKKKNGVGDEMEKGVIRTVLKLPSCSCCYNDIWCLWLERKKRTKQSCEFYSSRSWVSSPHSSRKTSLALKGSNPHFPSILILAWTSLSILSWLFLHTSCPEQHLALSDDITPFVSSYWFWVDGHTWTPAYENLTCSCMIEESVGKQI